MCLSPVVVHIPAVKASADLTRDQDPELNWWDARNRCITEFNDDLFIPQVDKQLLSTVPNLEPNTFYWIGGMATYAWKWTDKTPLFKHLGYMVLPRYLPLRVSLQNNSVFECYRHCNLYWYIGLSDRRCYCLCREPVNLEAHYEMECRGNPDEKCSDSQGMSMYTQDLRLMFDVNSHSFENCAYIRKDWQPGKTSPYGRWQRGYWYLRIQPENCHNTMQLLCFHGDCRTCRNGICTGCPVTTWSNANKTCKLLTAKTSRRQIFKHIQYWTDYWIGLYKHSVKRWNSGRFVEQDYGTASKKGQKCLAVLSQGMERKMTAIWIPCAEKHKSLCNDTGHTFIVASTTPVTTKSKTSSEAPPSPTTTESVLPINHDVSTLLPTSYTTESVIPFNHDVSTLLPTSDTTESVIPINHDVSTLLPTSDTTESVIPINHDVSTLLPNSNTKRPQLNDAGIQSTSTNKGIYAGVGFGALLLMVLLVSLLHLLRRKRKLCFKQETAVVTFQAATNDVSSNGAAPVSDHLPVSTAIAHETNLTLHGASVQSKHSDPDVVTDVYSKVRKCQNLSNAKMTLETDTELSVSRKSQSQSWNTSKISRSESDYGNTRACQNQEDAENCYHHIGVKDEGEYDIAGLRSKRNSSDSTYNHIDATGFKYKGKEAMESESGRREEATDYYNIESTAVGCYSNTASMFKGQPDQHTDSNDDQNIYTLAKAM